MLLFAFGCMLCLFYIFSYWILFFLAILAFNLTRMKISIVTFGQRKRWNSILLQNPVILGSFYSKETWFHVISNIFFAEMHRANHSMIWINLVWSSTCLYPSMLQDFIPRKTKETNVLIKSFDFLFRIKTTINSAIARHDYFVILQLWLKTKPIFTETFTTRLHVSEWGTILDC